MPDLTCQYCSEIFHIKPSKDNGRHRYCSVDCRMKDFANNYRSILEERFLSKVVKQTTPTSSHVSTPCWMWQDHVNRYGYGYLTVMQPKKHKEQAHRVSMFLFKPNESIEGLHVCHYCHTKLCVNPEHLHPGSAEENIEEMVDVGRQAKGEELPQAVLTEHNVRAIRIELSNTPRKVLAERYGVCLGTIDCIAQGRSWKHVA
jgi:hypothetical protein